MTELGNRVAVVTGAGAGIGLAMARKFASLGSRVVLADRDAGALTAAVESLSVFGDSLLPVRADVTKAEEVKRLADAAYGRFGEVHILCNNAGVLGAVLPSWQQPLENWEWVFDVNVRGVIHGIHYFLPRMIEQDTEAYVLNTASIAGLISGPFFAPYNASKHAVVALSECLQHELAALGIKVRVGVLCPGWVRTDLASFEKKAPEELRALSGVQRHRAVEERDRSIRRMVASSVTPDEIAEIVAQAIEQDRFYIFPHPERKEDVRRRMEDILEERTPVFPAPGAK